MAERVYESIEVDAPVERVYRYWQSLENLPQFMANIEEVRSTGPDTTHWRVKGPLGTKMEFDARTTQDQPNQAIGWNTVDGNVQTSGQVRFQELGPKRTRVLISFDLAAFDEVGRGTLGEVASKAVANPKLMMQQDLQNFKEIIEGTATPEEIRRRPDPAELSATVDRLARVMDPDYVPVWLHTPVPALGDERPLDVLARGDHERLSRLISGLESPTFS